MRRERFRRFLDLLGRVPRPVSILDVGGRAVFWERMGRPEGGISITILNVEEQDPAQGFRILRGDARDMSQFRDGEFDVVFSNSVIEHVGTWEDQRRAAEEMQRVGRRHWVQTPDRHFPMEPHFLVPWFQYLPVSIRAWLLTHRRLGWIPQAPDYQSAMQTVTQIRLLSRREVRTLFPDSEIWVERLWGLPKSLVAYGGWYPQRTHPGSRR